MLDGQNFGSLSRKASLSHFRVSLDLLDFQGINIGRHWYPVIIAWSMM